MISFLWDMVRDPTEIAKNFSEDVGDYVAMVVADAATSYFPRVLVYKIEKHRSSNKYSVVSFIDFEGNADKKSAGYPPLLMVNWKNHYDLLVHRVHVLSHIQAELGRTSCGIVQPF
jgi:hypothetical protein